MRIAHFVAFVVAWFVFLRINLALLKKAQASLPAPRVSWQQAAESLLGSGMLLVTLYVLGGVYSRGLVLAYLGATMVSLLLGELIGITLGSSLTQVQLLWLGIEQGMTHPRLTNYTLRLIGVIAAFGLPIGAGVLYFSKSTTTVALSVQVVRDSLLAFFILGLPLILTAFVVGLPSKSIQEGTRKFLLANGLAATIPLAVTLSLWLWTLRIHRAGTNLNVNKAFSGVPPDVLTILIGYLVLFLLIPYLLGTFRSRQHLVSQFETRKELLQRLLASLNRPAGRRHLDRLRQLDDWLLEMRGGLLDDPLVALLVGELSDRDDRLAAAAGEGGLLADSPVLSASAHKFMAADPRFRQLGWLEGVHEDLGDIQSAIQTETVGGLASVEGSAWVGIYRDKLEITWRDLEIAQKQSPASVVLSFLISSGILGAAVTFVNKAVLMHASHGIRH